MSRLAWGTPGERFYEAGVDKGVLYIAGQPGVSWSGLISVSETPSGGAGKGYYFDGIKYLNVSSPEEYEATLSAFSSPPQFRPCAGELAIHNGLIATQQPRLPFGLSYRTRVGNDIAGSDYGYKIHLVYNALAAPAQRPYRTLGGSPDPAVFSWAITTKPPPMSGYKPTAHLVIESMTTDPDVLSEIEDLLYGTESTDPTLPTPNDLIAIFAP